MSEEKTKIRLGKVSLMPRGTWNSASTYEKLDVVYVNGSSYVAVQDVPANTEILNTTFWAPFASKGETGESGAGADNIINMIGEEFDDTQAYAVGNYCIYEGALYRFTTAHPVGAWNSAHVTQVVIADELESLSATGCYNVGESVAIGGYNLMFAGRVGWSGKEIWFTIPLDKPISSNVTTVTFTQDTGVTMYLCTSNSAVGITNDSCSISVRYISRNLLSVQMVFDTAPLDITDGVVNIMLNLPITLTFS